MTDEDTTDDMIIVDNVDIAAAPTLEEALNPIRYGKNAYVQDPATQAWFRVDLPQGQDVIKKRYSERYLYYMHPRMVALRAAK